MTPAAWRFRCGGQNLWSYCDTEDDADFYIKASGVKAEKHPLYVDAAARIELLERALRDARTWHEAEDKALSKQPPSSDSQWRRMQHREQMDEIDAALEPTQQEKP